MTGVPTIKSGRFHAGSDFFCGDGVVIDVAEEVIVGDRVTLAPGTYLGGRRVTIGDDFFGYDWSHRGTALDVGRGRRDDEDAVLMVGSRCTFHDARIDLARRVTVGDDVGLSPEVVIYTHGYWMNWLEGHPCRYEEVRVGNGALIGFRSTLLAGTRVGNYAVVGAGAVCSGVLSGDSVYVGNPARKVRSVEPLPPPDQVRRFDAMMQEYAQTLIYRSYDHRQVHWDYPFVTVRHVGEIDVSTSTLRGDETILTDDLRWFLFTRGVRVYTRRPFRKLEKR